MANKQETRYQVRVQMVDAFDMPTWDPVCEGTLAEVVEPADSAAEELREHLPLLDVGGEYTIGGGAAPFYSIVRLS